ncbi:hypothetical protein ISN45_Aa04g026480 [Arabidopsis thaliana x Arabidopsis arenosa]|uniref:Uncharacterized protein n=1 Tax=Arabidopsis thaliana x Arabidopsis arenosa TaxID=1240361 RepID=A0A8T2A8V5_9BRAS|nr:hypothetical protein ISN45_Aa04g026480 [Arabidopsis thaliana x Arabidopsis arenosa]
MQTVILTFIWEDIPELPQCHHFQLCYQLGSIFILSHITKFFEMWSNGMHIQSYRNIRELLRTHKEKAALKHVKNLTYAGQDLLKLFSIIQNKLICWTQVDA